MCLSGQQYQQGQAVYPDQDTVSTGVFPDGTPFARTQSRKPRYVFVWKTLGKLESALCTLHDDSFDVVQPLRNQTHPLCCFLIRVKSLEDVSQ